MAGTSTGTNISRRRFLQATTLAGIATYIAPFGSASHAALFEQRLLTPLQWNPQTRLAEYRVDGIAKVTGSKIFARDIRARDLPNWPDQQSHALILRTTRADAPYTGFKLSLLGDGLQPDRIVTAADLQKDRVIFPEFYGQDMLLPEGAVPAYLGQAVAVLIFHDFVRFRLAKDALKFQDGVIQYGTPSEPLERDPWGNFRYVRVGGSDPYADDVYSSLKDTPIFPSRMRKRLPVWPEGRDHGSLGEEGMYYAGQIRSELDSPPDDWLVLKRQYTTQSTDVSALEADNANCWYDQANQTFHMVVASQSPVEVATAAAGMLAQSRFPVRTLVLHPCYTVGYGSKDHYEMPFYGLLCALYSDGQPVRIANDRYEQFQAGLKRHAFSMDYQVAVDRDSGKIQSCVIDMVANGGGRCNFSPSVAMVGVTAAQSIYYLPKSDMTSRADASRAVDAGSARGYGTLQSMAATEMLIDELAHTLQLDPIEFRLKNVLKSGMKNTQGAIPAGQMRAQEVLEQARKHPIWVERQVRKADFEAKNPGKRYGVGFACVQKDFGTGAESSFAKVELTPDGRIVLRHTGVEIGTGMSTSQALACARWLGQPASDIGTAITHWPDLPMETSGDPYLSSQQEQDEWSANPRWTPAIASAASASNSAFYYTHTTNEAARLVFVHGLWPAALAIWSSGIGGGQAAPYVVRREDARWVDGLLTADGMQPLGLSELARQAHEMGLVVGAVVHGFNRWEWARADFRINGQLEQLPIDGLAVAFGQAAQNTPPVIASAREAALGITPAEATAAETRVAEMATTGTMAGATDADSVPTLASVDAGENGGPGTRSQTSLAYQVINREAVQYPSMQRNNAAVTYYSAAATLVELAVHRATGQVEVLNHHSIIECGNPISPQLVSGQIQGGVAMGIGHALYEELPLYEEGPGNGTWNFNRYHLPLAKEVAVWKQTAEILSPLSDTDPPKGIAEVVMIPVVAAIVNGLAQAVGQRFYSLPVTPEKVQEALA